MQPWHNFKFFCPETLATKPVVAISACLMGDAVRYDGGDQRLATTSTILGKHLTLQSICPEVGAGMPVPRPPIKLVEDSSGVKAIGRDDHRLDVTRALQGFCQQSLAQSDPLLCGYIFKARSPSCGMGSTPIFDRAGNQLRTGNGLQTEYYWQHRPWLVCTEETQLQTESQCQHFILSCLLSLDLQSATRQAGLAAAHRHYQFLIKQMNCETQQRLTELISGESVARYWELLLGNYFHNQSMFDC